MSEGGIGNGGLTAPLKGGEFTEVFGEKRRPKMPESPSNPDVTDALLNDDKGALYEALEAQRQKKRRRKSTF
jgi:hypothetical protein